MLSPRIFLPFLLASYLASSAMAEHKKPNVVFIMSDELAYYELSHMGNTRLHTPRIDRMATEGIRFTQAMAGAPVCAPLRCTLMTGKHMGHASVRANDGGTPLRADEPTIASMLKERGYATGGFGKWGAGGRGSTGVPETHGFDVFFGYYDQVHAHSFYPPYLIRNSKEVVLDGNKGGREGDTYSHYAIMDEAIEFIRENKEHPFFCYLPITPPHGMYDIPASDPAWQQYGDDEWVKDPTIPQDVKNYAAMVTMIDNNLGTVLDLLQELDLEDDTIVFFTGDNGGQDRFRSKEHPRGFFGPNVNPKTGVEFRGGKGNLYEGGLRIPFLVRWPGYIKPGRVSDLLFYQPDMMPTIADLTGANAPENDGMSILPEIFGPDVVGRPQPQHDMLYWEYGAQVAVRHGDWKAIQPKKDASWELYNLSDDISETENIAEQHADELNKMKRFAAESHTPVMPGSFSQRIDHERDRQAKWGSTKPPQAKSPKTKVNRMMEKSLIPVAKMKLLRFSSENRGNGKVATNAIDGDPTTIWHSSFSDGLAKPPHELVIDLGASYNVRGFRYLARQDSGWNGAFGETDFYVSDSPEEFGQPMVTANFTKVRTVQKADGKTPMRGRYVRIQVKSEANGSPWASAAEIGVVGSQ